MAGSTRACPRAGSRPRPPVRRAVLGIVFAVVVLGALIGAVWAVLHGFSVDNLIGASPVDPPARITASG